MTEEKIIENIKPFIDACDKMTQSKFIMIDKRISDVLKSIARTDLVFEVIKECMINFNFEKEFKTASSKAGHLNPPEDKHKFVAFAFSLLNYLDDKKISASELLSNSFSKSENPAGPYSEFCDKIIVRFKDSILSKILGRIETSTVSEPKEILINKDILSRLAFLLKDLKDYVQGLKKLKKSKITKGELLEIISSMLVCVKNSHVEYLKAFVYAIKAGCGKEKEIERRLVEILEIVNNSFIEK